MIARVEITIGQIEFTSNFGVGEGVNSVGWIYYEKIAEGGEYRTIVFNFDQISNTMVF